MRTGRPAAASRVPPHNLEAEASLLGSMLLNAGAVAEAMEVVIPDDFWSPAHREVYDAIVSLDHASQPIDAITVAEELRRRGELDKVGGHESLLGLVETTPSPGHAAKYARIIHDHARLRRLIGAASEISDLGYEAGENAADIIDHAETLIFEVTKRGSGQMFVSIHDLLDEALGKLEHLFQREHRLTGLPTGFRDLDDLTSGLQPANLVVVAARPSMGKTAFALSVAQHAARQADKAVALFSLEMSKAELVQRLLAAEAAVDSSKLRTGRMNDEEWRKLMRAAGRMAEDQIFIDDSGVVTVMELRAKARRLAARNNLGLIVVDYLQLMDVGALRRDSNRQQDISEISRSLKSLARELDVPVIAVSQLNRAPEARADKRPLLGDLRESGAIEQDADIVIFLYRDSYYDPETPDKGQAEVIVAKHRNGPTATIKLLFFDHITKFVDLAQEDVAI